MNKPVFVFGSNEGGRHGKGAALTAYKKHGARYGKGYGHYGSSFAIPTMDLYLKRLSLEQIDMYVQGFIAYAQGQPTLQFQVTRIGCGLAGHTDENIAPMFATAPKNCFFDTAWHAYLGLDLDRYWGTFP